MTGEESLDLPGIVRRTRIGAGDLDDELAVTAAGCHTDKGELVESGLREHRGEPQGVEDLAGQPRGSMVGLATRAADLAAPECLEPRVDAVAFPNAADHRGRVADPHETGRVSLAAGSLGGGRGSHLAALLPQPIEACRAGHRCGIVGRDALGLGAECGLPVARVAEHHAVGVEGVEVAVGAGIPGHRGAV